MYYFLRACIDTLFPPSPDTCIVRTLTRDGIDTLYAPHQFEGIYALTHYGEPTIRALVHEAKFKNNRTAQKYLGTLLTRFLNTSHVTLPTLIIPIPLSPKRKRERGYNQVEQVLSYALLPNQFTVNASLLIRTRHTTPQTSLLKAQRLTNIHNCFSVKNPLLLHQAHILLIDDVSTTGATLSAAKTVLRSHEPASITCLALAH